MPLILFILMIWAGWYLSNPKRTSAIAKAVKKSKEIRLMRELSTSELPKKVTHQQLFRISCHPYSQKGSDRAAQLLWDHLSVQQKTQLINERIITVESKGKTIRIWCHDSAYTQVKTGWTAPEWRSICIYVENIHELPLGDQILAKKIAFEADPNGFLRTAYPRNG